MRLFLVVVALVLGTGCGFKTGAVREDSPARDEPRAIPRTPTLTWVFDDRLHPASQPTPGELLAGDELVVVVDTTQRFAGTSVGTSSPFFRTAAPANAGDPEVVFLPPGVRHLYLAGRGQNFAIQPGRCDPDDAAGVARSAQALDCTPDAARTDDQKRWARAVVGVPPLPLDVYACPEAQAELVPDAGTSKSWSLIKKRSRPAADEKEYECIKSWEFRPDTDTAVESVTLITTTNGNAAQEAAVDQEGVWRARTSLKAGSTSSEVRVKYKNGLTNSRRLGEFNVQTVEERSLVRIQPELMTTRRFRAVNLAVAITPVSPEFFRSGPWSGKCCWFMNGINPSMVVRFSGDNTTIVQFGVGLSFFLNKAMLINTGLLFGSTDATQYWNPLNNYFVGFAIDPLLLTELRKTQGGGNTSESR